MLGSLETKVSFKDRLIIHFDKRPSVDAISNAQNKITEQKIFLK